MQGAANIFKNTLGLADAKWEIKEEEEQEQETLFIMTGNNARFLIL